MTYPRPYWKIDGACQDYKRVYCGNKYVDVENPLKNKTGNG